jgi:hypothetical protein
VISFCPNALSSFADDQKSFALRSTTKKRSLSLPKKKREQTARDKKKAIRRLFSLQN